jgi:hypothetical protein
MMSIRISRIALLAILKNGDYFCCDSFVPPTGVEEFPFLSEFLSSKSQGSSNGHALTYFKLGVSMSRYQMI